MTSPKNAKENRYKSPASTLASRPLTLSSEVCVSFTLYLGDCRMTNKINVTVRRAGHSEPRRPHCFAKEWEYDDLTQCRRCAFFHECGEQYRANRGYTRHTYHNRTPSGQVHYSHHGQPVHTIQQHQPTKVVDPKRIEHYPMGTEYLPPERAGKSTAMQRFVAMATTEAISAAAQQVGHGITQFFKDPANFSQAAGQWRYGDNYQGKRKRTFSMRFERPAPAPELEDRPPNSTNHPEQDYNPPPPPYEEDHPGYNYGEPYDYANPRGTK